MMWRALVAVAVGVLPGCASTPDGDPAHTLVLQFGRAPTSVDVAAVQGRGGTDVRAILVAHAVSLRSSARPEHYLSVPGVQKGYDLGVDEDPRRSVFLEVDGEPTVADTAFVRAAGALLVGILPPSTIVSEMHLSAVPNLEGYPRFLTVTLGLDDNVPQPDPSQTGD